MAQLSAMYQDIILHHYRAPHGRGLPAGATAVVERSNPLCGDQISVGTVLHDGRIADVGFEGRGCSIATASASMLTDAVRGLSVDDALALGERVGRLVRGEPPPAAGGETEALGDLQSLAGVASYAQRHGCALMAWQALREGLAGH